MTGPGAKRARFARACLGAVALTCTPAASRARDTEPVRPFTVTCPKTGDDAVTVETVEPWLELRLTDGRVLRLAGLEPVGATPGDPVWPDTARGRLAALVAVGRPVHIRLLDAKPDRWGRLPAYVFTDADPGEPGGVAAAAVGAGLGRWRAEPAAHGCRDVLRAAETVARAGSLGLWHDPYYGVLAAAERAAFEGRSATVVVTEGQLTAVERGPFRTRLKFAAQGRHGSLIATLLPRVVKTIEGDGVRLDALIGRTLRVRGLLDLHFGPNVTLAGADALEVLPTPGGK